MTAKILVICHAILLSGCCALSKRTCCPACPPTEAVKVEVPCQLPPQVMLEAVKRQAEGCPDNLVCYDIPNAGRLAKNISELKDWIREVRHRCKIGVDSAPVHDRGL